MSYTDAREPYPTLGILHITRKTYFSGPDIGLKAYF